MNFRLDWKGDQVARQVEAEVIPPVLGEVGLWVEREAKLELYSGHGLVTGTLRSSIHTAEPDYNWAADDTESKSSPPERGGKLVEAIKKTGKIIVQVGSGMVYAMAIHQGWPEGYPGLRGSFEGYHFLTNAVDKVRPRVPGIVARHKLR